MCRYLKFWYKFYPGNGLSKTTFFFIISKIIMVGRFTTVPHLVERHSAGGKDGMDGLLGWSVQSIAKFSLTS